MERRVTCPTCGNEVRLTKDELIEKRGACFICDQTFDVTLKDLIGSETPYRQLPVPALEIRRQPLALPGVAETQANQLELVTRSRATGSMGVGFMLLFPPLLVLSMAIPIGFPTWVIPALGASLVVGIPLAIAFGAHRQITGKDVLRIDRDRLFFTRSWLGRSRTHVIPVSDVREIHIGDRGTGTLKEKCIQMLLADGVAADVARPSLRSCEYRLYRYPKIPRCTHERPSRASTPSSLTATSPWRRWSSAGLRSCGTSGGGSAMAFSRSVEPKTFPRGDDLTSAMTGIGMLFSAEAARNPNIEDTLVAASIEGMMHDDLRVLSILVTWLGVHHGRVNADRLTRVVAGLPLAGDGSRVRAFWSAIATWREKDRRFARLRGVYAGPRVDLLRTGSEFQVRRRGEDPRFQAGPLRAPEGVLRDRVHDVLTPEALARSHATYRHRVLMGPSYRADMWAVLETSRSLPAAELARQTYGSFATAWQVKHDFTLLREVPSFAGDGRSVRPPRTRAPRIKPRST